MCLPTRRTFSMREPSSAATISSAEDFNGCGLSPSHTEVMASPATRRFNPLATVSTSGNSGMSDRNSQYILDAGKDFVQLRDCRSGPQTLSLPAAFLSVSSEISQRQNGFEVCAQNTFRRKHLKK